MAVRPQLPLGLSPTGRRVQLLPQLVASCAHPRRSGMQNARAAHRPMLPRTAMHNPALPRTHNEPHGIKSVQQYGGGRAGHHLGAGELGRGFQA